MGLTGAAHTTYWTVIVQVIPVLALALVIESRQLAQRWQRKRHFKRRLRRWVLASAFLIIVLTLPIVLSTALSEVVDDTSSPFGVMFVTSWVFLATMLVVYIPAFDIVNLALLDLGGIIIDSLPWSRARRRRRERDQLRTDILQAQRKLRANYVDHLGNVADSLVKAIPVAIALDRTPGKWTPELRRQWAEGERMLAETQAGLREVKDAIGVYDSFLERVDATEEVATKVRAAYESYARSQLRERIS